MAIPECDNGPCDNGKSSSSSSLNNDKKVLVISQEIKFARVLAGNNPKSRDRALKNLKKWLENRAKTVPFTEDDFMRIWKGLFYSMWMSDKPLIQEECAENISSLLHSLPTTESSLLFFKSGLMILINEWFGIDQLRLDKFLMLVRRLLRQAIVVLKNANFQRSTIKLFTKYLSETILKTNNNNNVDDKNNKKIPLGLLMHFTDIYLEELAKIGGGDDGELNINLLPEFLTPFIQYLALCDDDRLLRHINDNIFIYLIKQSDLGLEYQAKYNVWRQQQFRGTIDDIKRIEIDDDVYDDDDDNQNDDDGDEKIYDPRAGRINVELPQLKFHPKAIAAKLLQHKFDKGSSLKTRKTITKLAELFKQMATGKYPIGIKQLNLNKNKKNNNNDDDDDYQYTNINNAAKRLIDFDDELMDRKPQQQQTGNGNNGLLEKTKNKKSKIDENDKKDNNGVIAAINKKTKRKNLSSSSSLIKKRQKIATNKMIENNSDKIESIFTRNSGIWIVTTTTTNELPQTIKNNDLNETKPPSPLPQVVTVNGNTIVDTNNNNNNKENKTSSLKKKMEEKKKNRTINKKVNNKNLNKLENKKKLKKILSRNLLENMDQKLVNNLTGTTTTTSTSTPSKKVKINTKLNTSQDVFEHHEQIKSSPAIPYDASKRPLKPLLKTTTSTTTTPIVINSPINPFYNCL